MAKRWGHGELLNSWEVQRADGSVEIHLSVTEPPPEVRLVRVHDGHHRRGRDTVLDPGGRYPGDHYGEPRDASAGAPGELRSDVPLPGGPRVPATGDPGDPDGQRGVPTAGGVNPPEVGFLDARSLRISGRDQNGRMWSSRVYGGADPQGQPWAGGEDQTTMPPPIPTTADSRHEYGHISDLGRMQRYLDAHYRR